MSVVANLGNARITIGVDIGFGDKITPAPKEVDFPTLLDFPEPRLRAYPVETVVAEKLQTLVSLGIANSRMKDFFDLWHIARNTSFNGRKLSLAQHFSEQVEDLHPLVRGVIDFRESRRMEQPTGRIAVMHLGKAELE